RRAARADGAGQHLRRVDFVGRRERTLAGRHRWKEPGEQALCAGGPAAREPSAALGDRLHQRSARRAAAGLHELLMVTRRKVLQGAGAALPFALRMARSWAETAAPAPALGALRAVTITAPDLSVVEKAWTRFLGYKLVNRGRIGATAAASWDAPAIKGKPYVVLGPESGEPTYVRFVEQAVPKGFDGSHTLGWTTTEITVQNSEQLYEKLKGSPFVVRRPPQEIPTYPYLRAMQAVGAAGE